MLKIFLILGVGLLLVCEEVAGVYRNGTCPAIKLKYGRTRYRQKGRFAKFVCNTGYLIAGEKYSTCVNGTWDGVIPKCVRASCKNVNPPINGLIYPSHRGAVLNFFCKPGFDLVGITTLYCDGHTWDTSLPSCILANTKPLLRCNFESPDLCGWNHDLRHDFDWTRMNYKTPSGHLGTGPSFDHTFGEGKDGYYMYIESSSRKVNDTARLISPIYDKMNENVCLEFFYHMHGASTGQLRVYLKRLSDPWLLYPENAIFWKIGNHGDKWLHSFIHMGPITEDFQIIFEGVRGTSFYSDTAIDDISIIPNCTVMDVTTEREEISTVDYLPTQSCMNRCDNKSVVINSNLNQQSCGCDETCTDFNTCCPDYIAVCVVGVTDDSYMTTETTALQAEITPSPSIIYTTKYNNITNSTVTLKPNTVITTKLTPIVTQYSQNNSRTTTPRTITTKEYQYNSTSLHLNYTTINSTIKSQQTPSVPKNVSKTSPVTPPGFSIDRQSSTSLKPSNTPVKTPVIPINTSPVNTSSSAPIKPSTGNTNKPAAPNPKVPVKPISTPTNASVPFKSPNESKKLPNVPVVISNSTKNPQTAPKLPTFTKYVAKQSDSSTSLTTLPMIDTVITVPVQLSNQDNEDEIEVQPDRHKDKEISSVSKVENQKIVKEAAKSSTSTTIVVVAVLSVSTIVIIVLGAALVRRYQYSCNRSRIRGSGSESQSDVRFLASDELLDFHSPYSDN